MGLISGVCDLSTLNLYSIINMFVGSHLFMIKIPRKLEVEGNILNPEGTFTEGTEAPRLQIRAGTGHLPGTT